MQPSEFFEHIEVRAFASSIETNAHHRVADVQIAQEDFRQPVGQVGIEQQQIGWGKRIEAQHGLQNRKYARRRPCLRPVCLWIKRREWVFIIPRMTAETLRKSVIVEQ